MRYRIFLYRTSSLCCKVVKNMKKVKYILTAFIMLFCMVLNSEMYQNHLNTFNENVYYFNVECSETYEKSKLINLLKKTVEENQTDVFCIQKNTLNSFNSEITIYSSSNHNNSLNRKHIYDGIYKSLFLGTTSIKFLDFENLIELPNITTYYLNCDLETARNIRNTINSHYACSYVHKNNDYNKEWLVPAIYIICGIFLLILTWLDIQFQKKEIFVLISLGKSRFKILLKNVFFDFIISFSVTILIYLILKEIIYLNYLQNFAILVYTVYIIANSSLYFSILFFDYKQVIYGANIKHSMLSNAYVLKSVVTLLTIISLSSNVLLIAENFNYINQYKVISNNFSTFSFLKLHKVVGSEEEYSKTLNKIFIENYKEGNVAFSVINYDDSSDYTYIMIDKNCHSLICDVLQEVTIDKDVDYTILFPQNCKDIDKILSSAINSFHSIFEDGFENAIYDFKSYTGNHYVTYFDSANITVTKTGFNNIKNPIIIFCNISEEILSKEILPESFSLNHVFSDIMYSLSQKDIEKINVELTKNSNEESFYITAESVVERCGQNILAFFRIVIINLVISLFMLILNFTIITTIIKMEFKVCAVELALKKILGHSIVKRYRVLIVLNVFTVFIGVFSFLIICVMLKLSAFYIPMLIGVLQTLIEIFMIFYYVIKIENVQVSRILKGGSL